MYIDLFFNKTIIYIINCFNYNLKKKEKKCIMFLIHVNSSGLIDLVSVCISTKDVFSCVNLLILFFFL